MLIYGEYSGYGKSLAAGFRELGHEAAVFSPNGDGWKNIESDFGLSSGNKFKKLKELLRLIPVFLKFDIVYIMNPTFFNIKLLGPVVLLLFKLKKIKLYLLCCGDDVEYIRAGEVGVVEKFTFSGVDYPKSKYFKTLEDRVINYLCALSADKIIPTMYDYEVAWKNSRFVHKVQDVIPLACYINSVPKIKKTDITSIKIMHGINRRDIKGTEIILLALNKIKKEFDNVIVFTPEKLSQIEYLKLFSEIDISIDQCKCHSYGMNAIYAMFSGHIVLAPADKNHCKSFKIKDTPIVSISSDQDEIYEKIKKILLSSAEDIDNLKEKTQKYALQQHQCSIVCSKLLQLK